ncbi:LysM domain-containing protein [Occultella aeris]|uniref:LysM domain-containing protein n=1 Tax=Occultella aeris TaxID=2761496 RepID=A0A7M4DL48_9MICO|nr:LysM domain-containing protein [Occultella aeris]VZO37942.1 hypothetical protein HALOF300_02863 [Occultella aeris]
MRRALLTLGVAGITGGVAAWLATMALPAAATPRSVDEAIALGLLWCALGVLAWYCLSAALALGCLTARAAGRGWSAGEQALRAGGAPFMARMASVGVGVALAAGALVTPAQALPMPDGGAAVGADVTLGDGSDLAPGSVPAPASASALGPEVDPEAGTDSEAGTDAEAGSDAETRTDAVEVGPDLTWGAFDPDDAATSPAEPTPERTDSEPSASPSEAATSELTTRPEAGPTGDPSDQSDTSTQPQSAAPSDASATNDANDATSRADVTPMSAATSQPQTGSPSAMPTPRGPAGTATGAHEVAPGETLWSIAAADLARDGSTVTEADIAAAWPRWYAANAATIGADPDLIQPGQELVPPTNP